MTSFLDGSSADLQAIGVSLQYDPAVLQPINFSSSGPCDSFSNQTCSQVDIFGAPDTSNSLSLVSPPNIQFGDPPGFIRVMNFAGFPSGIAPVFNPNASDTATFVTFQAIGIGSSTVLPVLQGGDGIFADFSPIPLNASGITVSVTTVFCGNGLLDGAEQCDDGSNLGGDGCDAVCLLEPGWDCFGEPSVCDAAFCGDGLIIGSEACDDSNTSSGDGCSASCVVEAGAMCTGEPSVCIVAVPMLSTRAHLVLSMLMITLGSAAPFLRRRLL